MKKWVKWLTIIVVALVVLADLVMLNLRVLRRRDQPPAEETAGTQPYPDSDLGRGKEWMDAILALKSPRWEWWWKTGCYVSNRPDLSEPVDQERLDQLHSQAAKYLEASGLDRSDARDFRFARSYWGIIVRFYLSPENLNRFLADKTRLNESAKQLLGMIYDQGQIEVEYDEEQTKTRSVQGVDAAVHWFGFAHEYPFVRLTWWPIDFIDAENMTAYQGIMTWKRCEAHPGANYFIFTDEKEGLVYLIGG